MKLPRGYLRECKRTGHFPVTADYALWLVTVKHLSPAVVPINFTADHLNLLPPMEAKRWLRTARRRYTLKQRRAA